MAALAPPSFSTSTSSLRASQSAPPQQPSYTDSPLTRLPTIDIPFEDLKKRMKDFSEKFDAFIEKGRRRVLEDREQFRGKLSELSESTHATTSHISTLSSHLQTHSTLLSRETAEKSEILSSISQLENHSSTQSTQRDKLRQQIAQTQRLIEQKVAAQREYAGKQDEQSRLNGPELDWWERYLGCRIEGGGEEGRVRVVYVFPEAKSGGMPGEREATFELSVPEGGEGYEVVWCKPRLERGRVGKVVERLNESRELGGLLRGMRGLFGEEVK